MNMYEKAFIYYLALRISTQTILLPIYIALIILFEKILTPIIKPKGGQWTQLAILH